MTEYKNEGDFAGRAGGQESHYDEKALLLRVTAGEEKAFEIIVDRHWPKVYAVAMDFLKSAPDSQDIGRRRIRKPNELLRDSRDKRNSEFEKLLNSDLSPPAKISL